jgi:folate-binding protein YgfZ
MPATAPAPAGEVAYEGVRTPAWYSGIKAEWKALDEGAGVLDASWRRWFTAVGEERREFLHGQTTASVTTLAPGTGAPAATLTAQGRPIAMFALYETGERIWIASTVAGAPAARTALSRFLVADDCDFEDDVEARCMTIAGPRAADILARNGAAGAPSLGAWATTSTSLAGEDVQIFSRSDLRVPCYDVVVCNSEGKPGDGDRVLRAIESSGAVRCGVSALEIVRIESGTVRYGVDVDEKRIAVEARLEWSIHFAKGCYVGQEVIERAVSRGRINHEICLLEVSRDVEAGAAVEGGADSDVVTSVAVSPRLGPIALAYLPAAKTAAGTKVMLRSGDASSKAVVLPWPRARVLTGRG